MNFGVEGFLAQRVKSMANRQVCDHEGRVYMGEYPHTPQSVLAAGGELPVILAKTHWYPLIPFFWGGWNYWNYIGFSVLSMGFHPLQGGSRSCSGRVPQGACQEVCLPTGRVSVDTQEALPRQVLPA